MRLASVIVACTILLAGSAAMGQSPILSSAEVQRPVPYFTGNTILSRQPLTISTMSQSSQGNVLSCPLMLAERPVSVAATLATTYVPYASAPVAVQPPYALSYVAPEMVRLGPLVPVQGGYSTFGYGPSPAAPAIGQVGPIYPEHRLILQSPLPYGYVGVSPLFTPGNTTIVRVVP